MAGGTAGRRSTPRPASSGPSASTPSSGVPCVATSTPVDPLAKAGEAAALAVTQAAPCWSPRPTRTPCLGCASRATWASSRPPTEDLPATRRRRRHAHRGRRHGPSCSTPEPGGSPCVGGPEAEVPAGLGAAAARPGARRGAGRDRRRACSRRPRQRRGHDRRRRRDGAAGRAGPPRRLLVRRVVRRARRGRHRLRRRRRPRPSLGTDDHRPGVPRQPRRDPAQRPRPPARLEHRLRRADPPRQLGRLQAESEGRGGGRGRTRSRTRATGGRRRPSPTPSAPGPAGPPSCTRSTTTPRPRAGCCRSARCDSAAARARSHHQPRRPDRPDPAARRRRGQHHLRLLHRRRPRGLRPRHRHRPSASAPVNAEPQLRMGFEPRVWTVPPAAPSTSRCCPTGATRRTATRSPSPPPSRRRRPAAAPARATAASGRIRFTAPARADRSRSSTPSPTASATRSSETSTSRCRTRRPPGLPAVAEPDVVAGQAGKPITIRRSTTTCPAPTR